MHVCYFTYPEEQLCQKKWETGCEHFVSCGYSTWYDPLRKCAEPVLCGVTSFKLFLAWKSSLQAWCSLEKAHMGMHFSEGIAKGEEKGNLKSGVISFRKTCECPLQSWASLGVSSSCVCFFLVISEKKLCGGERVEWEGGCTVNWAHCECLAVVAVQSCCM